MNPPVLVFWFSDLTVVRGEALTVRSNSRNHTKHHKNLVIARQPGDVGGERRDFCLEPWGRGGPSGPSSGGLGTPRAFSGERGGLGLKPPVLPEAGAAAGPPRVCPLLSEPELPRLSQRRGSGEDSVAILSQHLSTPPGPPKRHASF